MSPADDSKKEGLLSGWSRRKLAARREAQAEDTEDTVPPDADPELEGAEPDPAIEPDDEEAVDADFIASLPSIDDITGKTDLAPFMRRGVPLALRNAALRKVWTLNPLIRDHIDPALDYAWDWNAPGGVPGGGGTLTGEGVAKMVGKLLGDGNPADDADQPGEALAEIGSDDIDQARPDDVAAVHVRHLTQDAEGGSGDSADPSPKTAESAEPAPEDRVNLPLTSARRHGGALPE
ncbi:MAG: DUF3306 domain-containing protein [Phyllobacteriaceae bacterium]|jgi:hypothetical protein|nr:DUF3306 domain-containing protein [Phyllobacteriaceae bacterium]